MAFDIQDRNWMELALAQAERAAANGEVPVGAVFVKDNAVAAKAGNSPIITCDPTAHAEINVIREASRNLANYRLGGTIYVTLEPCLMCMGAIIHSRVERLVFGAYDAKTGAAFSTYQIGTDKKLNHNLIVEGGLLEKPCGRLLKNFFQQRRD